MRIAIHAITIDTGACYNVNFVVQCQYIRVQITSRAKRVPNLLHRLVEHCDQYLSDQRYRRW